MKPKFDIAEFRRQLDEADDPPAPPVPAPTGKVGKSGEPRTVMPRARPSRRTAAGAR